MKCPQCKKNMWCENDIQRSVCINEGWAYTTQDYYCKNCGKYWTYYNDYVILHSGSRWEED